MAQKPQNPGPRVEVAILFADEVSNDGLLLTPPQIVNRLQYGADFIDAPYGLIRAEKSFNPIRLSDVSRSVYRLTDFEGMDEDTRNRVALSSFAQLSDEGANGIIDDIRDHLTSSSGASDGERYRGTRQPERKIDLPLMLGGSDFIERWFSVASAIFEDELLIRSVVWRSWTRRVRAGKRVRLVVTTRYPAWMNQSGWNYGLQKPEVAVLEARIESLRINDDQAPSVRGYRVPAVLTLVADEDPFWTSPPAVVDVPNDDWGILTGNPLDNWVEPTIFPDQYSEKTWRRFLFRLTEPPKNIGVVGVTVYKRATAFDATQWTPDELAYSVTFLETNIPADADVILVDTHPARRGAYVRQVNTGRWRRIADPSFLLWSGTPQAVRDPARVVPYAYATTTTKTQAILAQNARATPSM